MTTNRYQSIIEKAYKAFNARDVEAILSLMHPEVNWPNGWEGGYVQGTENVKDYWKRQWKELNPEVIPLSITEPGDNSATVKVHQVIKDLQDNLLSDSLVKHTYFFESGLITKMEIGEV